MTLIGPKPDHKITPPISRDTYRVFDATGRVLTQVRDNLPSAVRDAILLAAEKQFIQLIADEPTLPTPWKATDNGAIVDANGYEVFAVADWLTGEQQDELAARVAATINHTHGALLEHGLEEIDPAPRIVRAVQMLDGGADRSAVKAVLLGQPALDDCGHDHHISHADPLAHVVPGDPDPTTDTNIWCGAKDPLGGARVCHREDGHVGQHIGANGSKVVAVWRADASCHAEHRGQVCTREPGHPGKHIAVAGDEIAAAWGADA